MITVYKYPLDSYLNSVELPVGAKIHCVAQQGESICLWAEVDTKRPTSNRDVMVAGTGHGLSTEEWAYRNYVGTVHRPDGLVFHVFEGLINKESK